MVRRLETLNMEETESQINTQLCQNKGTSVVSYGSHESLRLFNASNINDGDDDDDPPRIESLFEPILAALSEPSPPNDAPIPVVPSSNGS